MAIPFFIKTFPRIFFISRILFEMTEFLQWLKLLTGRISTIFRQYNFLVYWNACGQLKTLINQRINQDSHPQNQILSLLERENSKIIYWNIVQKKIIRPTSEERIQDKFSLNIGEEEWVQIYSLPFCSTIEVKLRSFQFSINHLYYFSNDKLHHIGRSQTPNCTFCGTEVETVVHLFLECPRVQCLWDFINHIIIRINENCLIPNEITKLMGFYKESTNKEYMLINHMLLVVKYYIHLCRHRKTRPTVSGLKSRILDTEYLEKQIAIGKNKIENHNEKWGEIQNLMNW